MLIKAAAAAATNKANDSAGGLSKTAKLIILAIVIILIIVVAIYFAGKKAGKGAPPKQVKLPAGVQIPTGWSPRPVSTQLYASMKGAGTDTQAIWDSLGTLNGAQLALVYNDFAVFAKEKGEDDTDLMSWFEDDLSGDDLSRATNYFKGIV